MQSTERSAAYRRKTPDQRRRELIEAGIACLGEGGMSGFTIDQICRRAGVSRGLINHHFRTKEELLLRIYAAMTEHLVEEPNAAGPFETLRQVIDSNFDEHTFNASNLRAWLAVWGEIAGNRPLFELHRRRYRVYRTRIERAVTGIAARAALDIDANSLARQLIALIDGLWLEHCLHPDEFTLEMAKQDCHRLLRAQGIGI